jgi:hypothetical protein
MVHTGGVVVTGPEVTAQVSDTGLAKPPVDVRLMVPMEEPPGSTETRFNPNGMVIPKLWL